MRYVYKQKKLLNRRLKWLAFHLLIMREREGVSTFRQLKQKTYPCYPLTCCVNAYWCQWLCILGTLNWSISVFTDVLCYCGETLCQVSSPPVLGLWDFSGQCTARGLRHNKQLACNSSELCLPPLFFPMQIVLHSLFEMQKEAQVWRDKQGSKRSTWWRGRWERQIWKKQQPHRWSWNDSAWIAWGLGLSKSPLNFSPFGPSSTWYSEASNFLLLGSKNAHRLRNDSKRLSLMQPAKG